MEITVEHYNKLYSAIDKLREDLFSEIKKYPRQLSPVKSENLQDLFAALAKAQGEMAIAGLSAENPFFKTRYADFTSIVKASRPALTKNGLSVVQQIEINEDGQNILNTILCHLSGQFIISKMRILPPKNDIQSMGSYISYLRRYSYSALIGVTVSDEDDDGEVAMVPHREEYNRGTGLNTKYNPKEQSMDTITKEQLEELNYELGEYPDVCEQVLEGLKIQSLSDMPKSKFLAAINRIRTIKNSRNGVK